VRPAAILSEDISDVSQAKWSVFTLITGKVRVELSACVGPRVAIALTASPRQETEKEQQQKPRKNLLGDSRQSSPIIQPFENSGSPSREEKEVKVSTSRHFLVQEDSVQMCEAYDSDTKRVEYDEDFEVQGVRVYLIDDGEQHWYVAKSMIDALKTHENLDGNEDQNDVTISVIKPDKLLTRTESDGIQETFPETFEIDRTEDQEFSRGPKVTTTAAEWANFYGKQAPTQIMSSVF
jgi:cytochrome c biogenesis protein ResB